MINPMQAGLIALWAGFMGNIGWHSADALRKALLLWVGF